MDVNNTVTGFSNNENLKQKESPNETKIAKAILNNNKNDPQLSPLDRKVTKKEPTIDYYQKAVQLHNEYMESNTLPENLDPKLLSKLFCAGLFDCDNSLIKKVFLQIENATSNTNEYLKTASFLLDYLSRDNFKSDLEIQYEKRLNKYFITKANSLLNSWLTNLKLDSSSIQIEKISCLNRVRFKIQGNSKVHRFFKSVSSPDELPLEPNSILSRMLFNSLSPNLSFDEFLSALDLELESKIPASITQIDSVNTYLFFSKNKLIKSAEKLIKKCSEYRCLYEKELNIINQYAKSKKYPSQKSTHKKEALEILEDFNEESALPENISNEVLAELYHLTKKLARPKYPDSTRYSNDTLNGLLTTCLKNMSDFKSVDYLFNFCIKNKLKDDIKMLRKSFAAEAQKVLATWLQSANLSEESITIIKVSRINRIRFKVSERTEAHLLFESVCSPDELPFSLYNRLPRILIKLANDYLTFEELKKAFDKEISNTLFFTNLSPEDALLTYKFFSKHKLQSSKHKLVYDFSNQYKKYNDWKTKKLLKQITSYSKDPEPLLSNNNNNEPLPIANSKAVSDKEKALRIFEKEKKIKYLGLNAQILIELYKLVNIHSSKEFEFKNKINKKINDCKNLKDINQLLDSDLLKKDYYLRHSLKKTLCNKGRKSLENWLQKLNLPPASITFDIDWMNSEIKYCTDGSTDIHNFFNRIGNSSVTPSPIYNRAPRELLALLEDNNTLQNLIQALDIRLKDLYQKGILDLQCNKTTIKWLSKNKFTQCKEQLVEDHLTSINEKLKYRITSTTHKNPVVQYRYSKDTKTFHLILSDENAETLFYNPKTKSTEIPKVLLALFSFQKHMFGTREGNPEDFIQEFDTILATHHLDDIEDSELIKSLLKYTKECGLVQSENKLKSQL